MKKLRVGLIGLGNVAQAHLQGYKEVEQIEVVAGADLQKDRLHQVSERWCIKGYTDYEEMLRKENLDVACVLTPPSKHREITEKVAEHKVSVLCEKPMALTLDDARSMIAKCRKEGVKLCYGETFRFLGACLKAKEMIEKGFLGDIFLLMEILLVGRGIQHWQPTIYSPVGSPGITNWGLMEHGIHLVDVFRWFTGSEAESVFGRGTYSGEPPGTEYLTVRFKNNAIGQLIYNEATVPSDMPYEGMFSWGLGWGLAGELGSQSSWEAHPMNIRIHGGKGALRVYFYANKLFFFGEDRQEQIRVLDRPHPGNFGLQMESFAKRLMRGEEPEVTGVDGLKALQIILAAHESFKTQKIIRIDS